METFDIKLTSKFELATLLKWSLVVLICKVGVSIVSNYVDYFPANFDSEFLVNRRDFFCGAYRIAFYTHVIASPVALFQGLILLNQQWRQSYRSLHRVLGLVQIGLVLILIVPSSLIMSLHTIAGPISGIGFATSALSMGGCIFLGWRAAIQRHFQRHRRWMLRSYVLLCSAILLRVLGGLSELLYVDPLMSYRLAAWASWLVPWVILEIYFARKTIR